jgi:hypothetical protein
MELMQEWEQCFPLGGKSDPAEFIRLVNERSAEAASASASAAAAGASASAAAAVELSPENKLCAELVEECQLLESAAIELIRSFGTGPLTRLKKTIRSNGGGDGAFRTAVEILRDNKGATINLIKGLISTDAAAQKYGPDFALGLARSVSFSKAALALVSTRADAGKEFVTAWCAFHVNDSRMKPQYGALVRASVGVRESCGTMAVDKGDVQYHRGGQGARTGFLSFTFNSGAPKVAFHTHWVDGTRIITSIHVKIGDSNGIEVNSFMDEFGNVAQAVLTAHNASAYKPTTIPLFSNLTLGLNR